jgi:hypothetical protein
MVRLTDFAHTEASKLHPVNSEQHFTAGKQLFFETLGRLQEQTKQNAAAQQPGEPIPAPDNQHIAEPAMTQPTPKFFEPVPPPPAAPRQQPSRPGFIVRQYHGRREAIEKRYRAPSAWANQAQTQFASVLFWTETSGNEVQ